MLFNPFRLLTQCKERAQKAIEKSEECASSYRNALAKNEEAHTALLAKIDRRGERREASAT